MRKYVITYTKQAYDEGKVDWNEFITGLACYGLQQFKSTIEELKNSIGLEYLNQNADILTGDGENSYSVGNKKIR